MSISNLFYILHFKKNIFWPNFDLMINSLYMMSIKSRMLTLRPISGWEHGQLQLGSSETVSG